MSVETKSIRLNTGLGDMETHMVPLPEGASLTARRKNDHIAICLKEDVQYAKENGFGDYEFIHKALPELNLSEIDTSTDFLGHTFAFPFFIEALTGGTPKAERINKNLARAAEIYGIGMGVGSQRAMLDSPEYTYTYQVRDKAPNILLLGNIGATQLAQLDTGSIAGLVKDIGADGLAVHLNAAQEMCQPEGDTDWRDVSRQIERVCRSVPFPVIVKETGCGIDPITAKRLESAGAAGIDIAGAGGTSFTKVEYHRGAKISPSLFEWGIPTADSLWQCREIVDIPLIASGGIRTGVECAKAIAMGASLAGFALPLLKPAQRSYHDVLEVLTVMGEELKRAMLLASAHDIEALKQIPITARLQRHGSATGSLTD
jgi:isopentenyl-diphosphate delta-isomerase